MNVSKDEKFKREHKEKLRTLYDTYYQKCLEGDTASLSCFLSTAKELMADDSQSELYNLIKNAKVDDEGEWLNGR